MQKLGGPERLEHLVWGGPDGEVSNTNTGKYVGLSAIGKSEQRHDQA
jgi:hypothetical protein